MNKTSERSRSDEVGAIMRAHPVCRLAIEKWERMYGPIDWAEYPSEVMPKEEASRMLESNPAEYFCGLHPATFHTMRMLFNLLAENGNEDRVDANVAKGIREAEDILRESLLPAI